MQPNLLDEGAVYGQMRSHLELLVIEAAIIREGDLVHAVSLQSNACFVAAAT
jgi:hypothetical protein